MVTSWSKPVDVAPDAAMMVRSSIQVAPRLGPSSLETKTGGPPVSGTFLNAAPEPVPGSK